ncbi:MAG: BolA family transcriptional regulator [Gammaproteobacteria bacterium]|nr:BolA family transcriptional regulator [Gammaproteobacteria bacterium]
MTAVDRVQLIKSALDEALSPQQLKITDDSHLHAGHAGAQRGGHFTVFIVAEAFVGKSLLQRHRAVYAALDTLMDGTIHALSIQAHTPQEI